MNPKKLEEIKKASICFVCVQSDECPDSGSLAINCPSIGNDLRAELGMEN